jgi:hypothetical protein
VVDFLVTYLKDQPGIGWWVIGAAAAVWIGPKLWRLGRRAGHAMDDLVGHPARDGAPEKPGALTLLHKHAVELQEVKAEVQFNHGGSLKDAVVGTRADLTELERRVNTRLDTMGARFDGFEGRLEDFARLLAAALGHNDPPHPGP